MFGSRRLKWVALMFDHTHVHCCNALVRQANCYNFLEPSCAFRGVDKAADAVEHLQGGGSIGKVILQLARHLSSDQEEPLSRL